MNIIFFYSKEYKLFGPEKLFYVSSALSLEEYVDIFPQALPEDVYEVIKGFHGQPYAWWAGQLVSFLLKPQKWLEDKLLADEKMMNFSSPIVGIHVRRTDKIPSEASFHALSEYMTYVEKFYKFLDLKEKIEKKNYSLTVRRRVYLATDELGVIKQALKTYPNYEFLYDKKVVKLARGRKRYTKLSLEGIIKDIHFLSKSDYLVCTFSSQICRLSYELMQTYHTDGANRVQSLDDIYYYAGQVHMKYVARVQHIPKFTNSLIDPYEKDGNNSYRDVKCRQLMMAVGDEIKIHGNHWDGYSLGTNVRTAKTGLFPSYKIEKIEVSRRYSLKNYEPEN
ncbi:hypothetical protein HELRODRAFT_170715 [Helobdella robusta]|uniref:GT23 domain-containing protein n=1 Tax=Helobdella robusta TaxID=6412 RepID=T1F3C5_HELRO|nr:hypothetical protein HELRODRAFT_170715 [Helobdella robusta]ESO07379.1 hypothetical protein HELRODRAFT_170715 [Helobdella robusta]